MWIRLEIIFLVCFVYVHWIVWIFKIFESVFAENFLTNVKSNEQKHEKHFDLIFSSSQRSWDFALNIQSTQSNWRNVIDLNDYKQRQVKKQELFRKSLVLIREKCLGNWKFFVCLHCFHIWHSFVSYIWISTHKYTFHSIPFVEHLMKNDWSHTTNPLKNDKLQ